MCTREHATVSLLLSAAGAAHLAQALVLLCQANCLIVASRRTHRLQREGDVGPMGAGAAWACGRVVGAGII